jgi:phage host-nuclease inhibitor protein Gam
MATVKRASKKVVTAVSREQYEEALSTYAVDDARRQQITSKMDVEITRIRDKYVDELTALEKRQAESFELVQTFCTENAEMFGKGKSVDTLYGRVGFRSGNPKLKPAKGFNWTSILALLKAQLPAYVRKTEEPDKASLLADRDKPEVLAILPQVGILVDQDERFYIELKKEEPAEI